MNIPESDIGPSIVDAIFKEAYELKLDASIETLPYFLPSFGVSFTGFADWGYGRIIGTVEIPSVGISWKIGNVLHVTLPDLLAIEAIRLHCGTIRPESILEQWELN